VDDDGVLWHRLLSALSSIHVRLHLLAQRGPLTDEQRELLDGAVAAVFVAADLARETRDKSGRNG
jgi:hypothetical protein